MAVRGQRGTIDQQRRPRRTRSHLHRRSRSQLRYSRVQPRL